MFPYLVDPAWYEQYWLAERAPPRWTRLASGIARALTHLTPARSVDECPPSVRFAPLMPSTSPGSSAGSRPLCPTIAGR